jgi:hypothetical protein
MHKFTATHQKLAANATQATGQVLKKRDDMIHEVQLELQPVNNLTQSMKMKFFAEAEINMLKLYFSKPKEGGYYSLMVEVIDGAQIVFSKVYPL